MFYRTKRTLLKVLGPIGGYAVARWLTRKTPKIIMYHRFTSGQRLGCFPADVFESQLSYLKSHFHITSMEAAAVAIRDGTLRDNTVVLTIDDGYNDFFDIAFPILQRHQVPATLFITTRFIDGDFWLWPDRVRYVLSGTSRSYSDLVGLLPPDRVPERLDDADSVWQAIIDYILSIDEDDKLDWLTRFEQLADVDVPVSPPDEYAATDWDAIREMAEDVIEIGAHTRTHPSLGHLRAERYDDEIIASVKDIEERTGRKVHSFCYPNGQPDDYNAEVAAKVKDAGCSSAVTAHYDARLIDDMYALRRFSCSDNESEFLKVVNGLKMLSVRAGL